MKILADVHEKNALVASEIIGLGIDVDFQPLKVADYIIGNVAVERKTVSDFINSMLDKRLINQLEELKQYEKRLLVIEGLEEQELYQDDCKEGMNGNSIRGMLLYITLEANCPIIFSKDYRDTAKFLALIAKKLENGPKEISLHAKKKSFNKEEQKQYILEAFPGIGPQTAKKLLKKFVNLDKVINASQEELKEILKGKTESFRKIISS